MTKTDEQIELAIGYRIRALQLDWLALETRIRQPHLDRLAAQPINPARQTGGVSFVPANGSFEVEALILRARAEIVMAGYDSDDEGSARGACLELLRSKVATAEEARQIAMGHNLYT